MRSTPAITVIGGGGIGGSVAGSLILAGDDVTVVERSAEHVAAIAERGLHLDGVVGDRYVPIRAVQPQDWSGPVDVALLAVSSHDTEAAVEMLVPYLREDSVVVSLQNGWNARRISARIGAHRTMAAMVHMAARYNGPGHVTRFARGDFYLGELDARLSDRAVDLAARLSAAVPTRPTANVWGYIWSKQVYATIMPANALVDLPVSEIVRHDWVRRVLVAIIVEAMQAAEAEGIHLEAYERFDPERMRLRRPADLEAAMASLPRSSALGNTGFWRALKEGRPTEVRYLSAEIVRIGRQHGLPMTLNGRVVELVGDIERGEREMDWQHLRKLVEPAGEFLGRIFTAA